MTTVKKSNQRQDGLNRGCYIGSGCDSQGRGPLLGHNLSGSMPGLEGELSRLKRLCLGLPAWKLRLAEGGTGSRGAYLVRKRSLYQRRKEIAARTSSWHEDCGLKEYCM